MLKYSLLVAVAAGLAAATPAQAQAPAAQGSGLSLHFGGYVKVDFRGSFRSATVRRATSNRSAV